MMARGTLTLLLLAVGFGKLLSLNCDIDRSTISYNKCNSTWKDNALGDSSTICESGDLISSLASALTSLNITVKGEMAAPDHLNEYLMDNGGYKGNRYNWLSIESITENLIFKGLTTDLKTILDYLCSKKIVLLQIGREKSHWVLLKSYDNGQFKAVDSDFSNLKTSFTWDEVELVAVAGIYNYMIQK